MFLAALVALTQSAAAIDVKWWGVGPTVGTVAIPSQYPVGFPSNAKDGEGDPKVQKVNGDILFGAHGVLYPSGSGRIGARALVGLGLGSPWSSGQLTIGYEHALIKEESFHLLFGGGIGAGTERFGGTEAHPDGYLVVNYFPVRAQITPVLRDKTRAYEVDIFGEYHIVADQTYFKQDGADGQTPEGLGGLGAVYLKVGVEATVFFGDFKNERKSGGGGGKKSGGKKSRR